MYKITEKFSSGTSIRGLVKKDYRDNSVWLYGICGKISELIANEIITDRKYTVYDYIKKVSIKAKYAIVLTDSNRPICFATFDEVKREIRVINDKNRLDIEVEDME